MLEIVEGKVLYNEILWDLLAVDGTSVHLVNGEDGVCVECTDPEMLAALEDLLGA